jgi:DNA-binding phage protein
MDEIDVLFPDTQTTARAWVYRAGNQERGQGAQSAGSGRRSLDQPLRPGGNPEVRIQNSAPPSVSNAASLIAGET